MLNGRKHIGNNSSTIALLNTGLDQVGENVMTEESIIELQKEIDELKAQNETLIQENEKLKKETNTLSPLSISVDLALTICVAIILTVIAFLGDNYEGGTFGFIGDIISWFRSLT